MLEEFKKFILRGNMVDLAVGVIIGSAFGKVVEKFAELITSIIYGLIGGRLDQFQSLKYKGVEFGPLITQTLNLVLVGFALFLFIKLYQRFLVKPRPEVKSEPSATEKLLIEIRDELKNRPV